jgi:hypothetical protein
MASGFVRFTAPIGGRIDAVKDDLPPRAPANLGKASGRSQATG